jgi:signal transduction histidine kinase
MSVAVESHHPRRAPGEAPPRFAFGEREQTQPSRQTLGESLAAGRCGEFLAMVLHELKNPLGSILAGVEFARDTEQLLPDSEWVWRGLENATR